MPEIQVVPLGAGQEVGRSCILVSIAGRNIMLDCGMHMGYNDDRRFPDFSYIAGPGNRLDGYLDCVIISHFHLDHCGALPYMTEMVGYNGSIYMTSPTKAICPELLEDYRRIQVDVKKDTKFFTSQMIADCMKKVVSVSLHEVVQVDKDLRIKAYYAGHVLGAAMFEIRVGSESVVYTGDFNMTPDRHLGAAEIDRTFPDLLISESTYATTIRDSKRARERDFLKKVHDCVNNGGKVLIPTFALGRAQELCILLESYWERMNLKIPIYFTMGLTKRATDYYKLFISWTNEKIKKTFVQRNMFDFKHIMPFDKSYADLPGPMVVFATPGMLHSGTSLQVFKKWAPDEKNMVIMPGYCVAGTCGAKIINGARKLDFYEGGSKPNTIDVKLAVEYMSFSAHADAKGIMQLIKNCRPRHVMFVHGEDAKMDFLKLKVEKEMGIPVFKPANGETILIPTDHKIALDVSSSLLKRNSCCPAAGSSVAVKRRCPIKGTIICDESRYVRLVQKAAAGDCRSFSDGLPTVKLVDSSEALDELNLKSHSVNFTTSIGLKRALDLEGVEEILNRAAQDIGAIYYDESKSCLQFMQNQVTVTVAQQQPNATPKTLAKHNTSSLSFDSYVSVSWALQYDSIGADVALKIRRLLSSEGLC